MSGRKAKRTGDVFERTLERFAQLKGWLPIKIPMGARFIGPSRIVRVETPFDFIFVKDGEVIFCDAKSTTANTWTYSSCTPHQVVWLDMCFEHGCLAGYVVNFSQLNKTVFFHARDLAGLRPGQGLSPLIGTDLGTNFEIDLNLILTAWDRYVDRTEKDAKTF